MPSQSSGGQTLATFANRRSPRFLDSDSDLERAANMFGINTRQSPARGSSARGSPARGTKRPATPSSSSSGLPHKSPRLSSPARGAPPRGVPGRGTIKGAGHSVPIGTVNPQPRGGRGRPGQAGFVQRGARGHLEVPLVSPYLASVLRKRTMKMTTTMMTKLISRIKATSKEIGKQYREENNPEIQ